MVWQTPSTALSLPEVREDYYCEFAGRRLATETSKLIVAGLGLTFALCSGKTKLKMEATKMKKYQFISGLVVTGISTYLRFNPSTRNEVWIIGIAIGTLITILSIRMRDTKEDKPKD